MLCSVNSVYLEHFSLGVHLVYMLMCQAVFFVHFNAVRCVSVANLTILLKLPVHNIQNTYFYQWEKGWIERDIFFLLFYIFFTTKESLMFQSVLKLPQMVSVSNSLYFREWRRQVVFQRIQYFHKVNIEVMMKNTKISAGTQIIQLFRISVKNCPSVKQLSSPQLSLQIHITQRPEPTI